MSGPVRAQQAEQRAPPPPAHEAASSDVDRRSSAALVADFGLPTSRGRPTSLWSPSSVPALPLPTNSPSSTSDPIEAPVSESLAPHQRRIPPQTHDSGSREPDLPTTTSELSPVGGTSPGATTSPCCPPVSFKKELRPFRAGSQDGYTLWWQSEGPFDLPHPPHILRPRPGDIYLHNNLVSEQVQSWVWQTVSQWTAAVRGQDHPTYHGRCLWFRQKLEPSWVTKHTYRTYKGKKRLEELVRADEETRTDIL